MLKMNQGYVSVSLDATPCKQKSRFVHETYRVDGLFNQHCTESVLVIYTVDLYLYFFS